MKFPLLKQIATILLLLVVTFSYSQRLQDEKHELILTELIENETGFDPSMKMSDRKQYFYEGTVAVTSKKDGVEKKYNFFLTMWNKKGKSFIVKNAQSNTLKPEMHFKDNKAFINKDFIDLRNTYQVEKYILSCMLFWLNQKELKNGTIVAN